MAKAPAKKTKDDRPAVDGFGIGEVDGKIESLTPDEHAARAIERNADEADDEEGTEEDFADLE